MFAVLSLAYAFSVDLRATHSGSITADEPFYLMTARSLIDDGNLDAVEVQPLSGRKRCRHAC